MSYSTIKNKSGECVGCGKYGPLTKKMCPNCYWTGIRLKSVNKQNERASIKIIDNDDLSGLIQDLDVLVSRFVRLSAVDKDDLVQCFTCSHKDHYTKMDAGHFIGRSCLFLRFDVARNIRNQCVECNRNNYGRIMIFARNLEKELPGVTDILMEESRLVHHWSRFELKQMISEFQSKLKLLMK